MNNYVLLITILLPVICGIFLLCAGTKLTAVYRDVIVLSGASATFISAILSCMETGSLALWRLGVDITVFFHVDEIGRLTVILFTLIWLLVAIYGVSYMKDDPRSGSFFGFFLISEGMVCALSFAGNIITFYIFFEFMTLLTLPLVMHDRRREAVMAGLKYLFYSIAGAFLTLFGIFLIAGWGGLGIFTYGGCLTGSVTHGQHSAALNAAALLMFIGLGTKAGMWPMHSWLPAAHPEAPTPASALLSAVITKTGVLGLIRVVYYVFGPDILRGTIAQKVWMALALITIFIGSMMAYREHHIKRRLAYSTVSQVSYILFGLAVMTPYAYQGALMHMVFHALIKMGLFLIAGVYMHETGRSDVEGYPEMFRRAAAPDPLSIRQIPRDTDTLSKTASHGRFRKDMQMLNICWLICSIALTGIPPLSGFVSKWYIGLGAFKSGIAPFSWAGPLVLIISALLTAWYLLPIGLKAAFRGDQGAEKAAAGEAETEKAAGETVAKKDAGSDGRQGTEMTAVDEAETKIIAVGKAETKKDAGSDGMQRPKASDKLPVMMMIPIIAASALTVALGIWPWMISI